MNLQGKKVLLTGASHGIGGHLAVELAKAGATLLMVARSVDALEQFRQQYGQQHQAYTCDLADRAALKSLTEKIRTEHQQLHGLIHCAGIGVYKPITDVTESEWDQTYAIGLTAPFLLTQQLLPLLQQTPDSLVLVIGSGSGTIPMRNRTVYCSLKFALRGWTLSLAEELEQKLPHVCLITLGSTMTAFGPLSLEEKKKEQAEGKAYFPVEWVANKLREIIEDDQRQTEVVLFPSDFGFGTWQKP